MSKNTSYQIRYIQSAFYALHEAMDHHSPNYADKLLEKCIEEEKGHRKWGPDFNRYHPGAISIKDAARLFAVKRVAEYILGNNLPEVKDYLHMQKSCFMAAAMALTWDSDIRKAWSNFDIPRLAALDYTDFVKAQTPKEQPCNA